MNWNIFREYDIRGIAETDLSDQSMTGLARAIGSYFVARQCRIVGLGRDVRLSSPRLRDRMVEGLVSSGLRVIDIGECPTPVLYYSLHRYRLDAGVMVTGSHNPPEYNGFKICVGTATIHGAEVQGIARIAEKGNFRIGSGSLEIRSTLDEYTSEMNRQFGSLPRQLRLVVDCGNGTAGMVAEQVFKAMGCQVIPLFCEVDGRFPNHHPDPTIEEYLRDLIRVVRDVKADLGVAFDGDGDRIGAVDEKGRVIRGDELLILYARDLLKSRPGAKIIADVKCSKRLYDDVEARGGVAIMWKAGHSLVKAKMQEEGAPLAGELSGHMFFADRYYGFDDAIYAAGRLLEICARSEEAMSERLKDLPVTFSTPELRLECPDDQKFALVEAVTEYFGQRYQTVTVDGVRVIFPDGWGLVRASNTQPAIVLRFEADSRRRLEEIRHLIEGKLEEVKDGLKPGVHENDELQRFDP